MILLYLNKIYIFEILAKCCSKYVSASSIWWIFPKSGYPYYLLIQWLTLSNYTIDYFQAVPDEDNTLKLDSYDTTQLFRREIINTLDTSTSPDDHDLDRFLFKTVHTQLKVAKNATTSQQKTSNAKLVSHDAEYGEILKSFSHS